MRLGIFVVGLLWTGSTLADTVSYTGTLSSTEDRWETNVMLSGAGTLTLQTGVSEEGRTPPER